MPRCLKKGNTGVVNNGIVVPTSPSYFYEDEIFRLTKSGEVEFGMVTENWEMYSSESEDSEDERESDKVPKGHVAVTWHPSGREGVVPESKVHLSDRSLMPGDVVRRLIYGKDTQRGYARSVKVRAVVQTLGTKDVFPSVPASSLQPVQKFPPDVAVYLDSWIGSVRDMRYSLTLRFSDKSVCTVDSYTIAEYFEDTRPSAGGFRNGDSFYPGQRLSGPLRYLRKGEWSFMSDDFKRAKDRKQVSGIVTRVEIVGVNVQWQYQTPLSPLEQKGLTEAEKPVGRVKPPDFLRQEDLDRLKCLNLFDGETLQLGDICYYTLPLHETPIDRKKWKKEKRIHLLAASLSDRLSLSRIKEKEEEYTTSGDEVEEIDLKPVSNPSNNRHEIEATNVNSGSSVGKKSVPKVSTRSLRKRKLKKTRQVASITEIGKKETQAVVEVLHTCSTVDVVWQDGTIEENMRSIDLYPIHHLDEHEFFPGDFVVAAETHEESKNRYGVVQNMDHNGRVANVKWFEPYTIQNTPTQLGIEEVSVYDLKDHPEFRFRPGTVVFRISNFHENQFSGGQVLDNYPSGQIRVWWANDVETECWPQDLFRIGDYDSDEGELWEAGEDELQSDDSWETDDEEEEEEEHKKEEQKGTEEHKEELHKTNAVLVESTSSVKIVPSFPDIQSFVSAEPVPHFSMLESVPLAHYFSSTIFTPSNTKIFLKTIQKEIGLLRNNLPDGILVKGYENRMDLFSVMIHGPKNTPYEGGIFFFDIQLPASYPDSPPLVQYISFCQNRLNPNLYECGKVCVSLLGTWSGKGNETWTSDSSVLQLLISIQGLILVSEPYYNEAGYERQRGTQQGEENSRMYNEMVLIKLLQSMGKMLTAPHSPWEKETASHIHSTGPMIIERYRKWLSEAQNLVLFHNSVIGIPEKQEPSPSTSIKTSLPGFPLLPLSKGFTITLRKTLEAFEKVTAKTLSNLEFPGLS